MRHTDGRVPIGEHHLDLAARLERLRTRRTSKWSGVGPGAIAAWVAEMDFELAAPIRRALDAALDAGDCGYPHEGMDTGIPGAFAARAEQRWGWHVDAERIELLGDVMHGVRRALLAVTSPGDRVVVQTPVYPPFLTLQPALGLSVVANPLDRSNADTLDVEHLRSMARDARALLVCSPHNPTGRVFDIEELDSLVAVAREYDLAIISDEIHAEIVHPGHRHIPLATLAPERTITVSGSSKPFNIAGLRCALLVPGDRALAERLAAVDPLDLDSVGTLAIHATLGAWSADGDAWQESVNALFTANRDTVHRRLAEILPHRQAQATYLAWMDGRGLGADPAARILASARVMLSDGRRFGDAGHGYVRLNYATYPEVVEEICDRIEAALRPSPTRPGGGR